MEQYFTTSAASPLESLPAGARIHFIGVCGVAMAQLAVALSGRGFRISGSDKEFYEPMGSLLERSRIEIKRGYSADHIGEDCRLVVIGNAVSRDNPEVAACEQRRLNYTCFPMLLAETVIGRRSIVITGTHGKTTTSALTAALLEKGGLDPGYFIGGVSHDLPYSLKIGGGALSVVEGDEYDSAFFAKVPKFTFYKPEILIVNAVEFDHADIYRDLEAVVYEFNRLVRGITATNAVIIAMIDDPNVARLSNEWRSAFAGRVITVGRDHSATVRIAERYSSDGENHITLLSRDFGEQRLRTRLPGEHNARNAAAAFITAVCAGMDPSRASSILSELRGVRRRLEVRHELRGVTVVEDFAHHPTAVREALSAVRDRWPKRRVWAIFEPRSATSRRKVFREEYRRVFGAADRVILQNVVGRALDRADELIDVAELAADISKDGTSALALATPQAIAELIASEARPGDLLLVMSNGSFGGLIELLGSALSK